MRVWDSTDLTKDNGIQISYDFNNDDLKERIGIIAVDEETVLIVTCHVSEAMVERSFVAEIMILAVRLQE